MAKLLFIDDEGFYARPYRDKLVRDHTVEFVDDAKLALEIFVRDAAIDCIILDIMMPTPAGIAAAATDDGLITGIWWLEQAKDILVARRVPVMILTNRGRSTIESHVHDLSFPPDQVEIRLKAELPAFAISPKIKILLARWNRS